MRVASARWPILAAALAVWALLVWRTDFLIDDAYISFRYARNWAESGVPTYDPGLAPVEGYSNFLLVVLLRWAYELGAPLEVASRALSVASGAGTIVLTWAYLGRGLRLASAAQALGTFTLALFPPFAVWCTGGLETASFTLLLLASYLALARRSGAGVGGGFLAGALGLLVALSRVEGFAWVLVVAACAWLAGAAGSGERTARATRFALFFAVYLTGYGAFLLWRHATYGEWVANTVHAKAGLSWAGIVRGLKTDASFLAIFLSPLAILGLGAASLRRSGRGPLLGALGMVAAAAAHNTLVGGDWMPFFRFLAPASPFLAIVAGLVAERGRAARALLAGGALVALLPVFGRSVVPRAWLEPLYFRGFQRVGYESEWERWQSGKRNLEAFCDLGRALGQIAVPSDSLTFGAIGAIGWFSGLAIHDRNGLVDREVARRPATDASLSAGHDKQVPRAFFLERAPTLFHAVFSPDPPSREVESALLGAAVQRVFREGHGEEPLRGACLPEFHPIHAEGDTQAGTLLVLRATADRAAAEAYWERVLGH